MTTYLQRFIGQSCLLLLALTAAAGQQFKALLITETGGRHHEYDGGRAFYTALGHMPEVYSEKLFLEHVYGGIHWAATGKGL